MTSTTTTTPAVDLAAWQHVQELHAEAERLEAELYPRIAAAHDAARDAAFEFAHSLPAGPCPEWCTEDHGSKRFAWQPAPVDDPEFIAWRHHEGVVDGYHVWAFDNLRVDGTHVLNEPTRNRKVRAR